jgi:hypothetical protein
MLVKYQTSVQKSRKNAQAAQTSLWWLVCFKTKMHQILPNARAE